MLTRWKTTSHKICFIFPGDCHKWRGQCGNHWDFFFYSKNGKSFKHYRNDIPARPSIWLNVYQKHQNICPGKITKLTCLCFCPGALYRNCATSLNCCLLLLILIHFNWRTGYIKYFSFQNRWLKRKKRSISIFENPVGLFLEDILRKKSIFSLFYFQLEYLMKNIYIISFIFECVKNHLDYSPTPQQKWNKKKTLHELEEQLIYEYASI